MIKLKVTNTLLEYERPLVISAQDSKGRTYVGVNFEEEENGYYFYFAQIRESTLKQFREGSCDLLYALTHKRLGKYRYGISWGEISNEIQTHIFNDLKPENLPKPGLFIPAPEKSGTTELREVKIDGRWGINDLRKFSDSVQDCYAFVFALTKRGSDTTQQKIIELFRKYPWRGGYSSVNFFDDLYKTIPFKDRATISSIQYASPGEIVLNMDGEVANAISNLVQSINKEDDCASSCYSEVHKWLREQGWLGKSARDLRLNPRNRKELLRNSSRLATAFGLSSQVDHILNLSKSDPLGAVKILLAYYRRLKRLADYVATGKASELFQKENIKPHQEK